MLWYKDKKNLMQRVPMFDVVLCIFAVVILFLVYLSVEKRETKCPDTQTTEHSVSPHNSTQKSSQ